MKYWNKTLFSITGQSNTQEAYRFSSFSSSFKSRSLQKKSIFNVQCSCVPSYHTEKNDGTQSSLFFLFLIFSSSSLFHFFTYATLPAHSILPSVFRCVISLAPFTQVQTTLLVSLWYCTLVYCVCYWHDISYSFTCYALDSWTAICLFPEINFRWPNIFSLLPLVNDTSEIYIITNGVDTYLHKKPIKLQRKCILISFYNGTLLFWSFFKYSFCSFILLFPARLLQNHISFSIFILHPPF